MNTLSAAIATALVAVTASALVVPAPTFLAAGPAIYPSYAVPPLAVPHPISYAAPSGLVLNPALVAPVPAVKTVFGAPAVVKTLAPAALAAPAAVVKVV